MIDIVWKRYTSFIISFVLLLVSVWMYFWLTLNYGIDITWWTQTEFTYDGSSLDGIQPEIAKIAAWLDK